MSSPSSSCRLGDVASATGLSPVPGGSDGFDDSRPVTGASVWVPGDDLPGNPDVLLVCPVVLAERDLAVLSTWEGVRVLAAKFRGKIKEHSPHLLLELGEQNPAQVITAVARATSLVVEEPLTRRLTAMQRSMSRALTESDPEEAVLSRLRQTCQATAAIIDRNGRVELATGPVPQALIHGEISRTEVESQIFDVAGWSGLAVRLQAADGSDAHGGWLVAAARRPGFPDLMSSSAVHIAGTLLEASQQMTFVARRQERAARATVLEQALAMRPLRHDAELAGQIAGLGLALNEEVRVVVAHKVPGRGGAQDVGTLLSRAFEAADVAHLMTSRDDSAVFAVQSSVASLRRTLNASRSIPPLHVGVGRAIELVADFADSFNDANLAVRALGQQSRRAGVMSYEDFDFATRLFSDVGLERMTVWAERYLAPLEGREALVDGLRAYFEHDQNINAAADSLAIHHNSLRYRLAKVEELLELNLKEPVAVSSTYLALTAVDLSRSSRSDGRLVMPVVGAPTSATDPPERYENDLGVVYASTE